MPIWGAGEILPAKNRCAKSKDGTVLEAVKEEQGGQVGKLEETRGRGAVKVLEDRSCREHLGSYCSNSGTGDSGSDQDSWWSW